MTLPRNRKLTSDRARQVLSYNKRSGKLRWRVTVSPRRPKGTVAGHPRNGYNRIKVDGRLYQATTVIWLIVIGRYPLAEIDHRDTNNSNDRWVNLREATRTQNNQNAKIRKDNTSGYKGVVKNGTGWIAQISADKKTIYLGKFITPELAHAAYALAAKELHGNFARPA